MNAVPSISRPILHFFRTLARTQFRRRFNGVRVSNAEALASQTTGPLIVYANHSSWWDVMTQVVTSGTLLPGRSHFSPINITSLERYAILGKIGVFGIEIETARGAAQMLRTGLKILAAGGVLWITPQGRFADVRERPLQFRRGLAGLAARVPGGCTVVPLAIEYVFWNEKRPEALFLFGEPIRVAGETSEALTPILEAALLDTMARLQTKALARDPAAFNNLLSPFPWRKRVEIAPLLPGPPVPSRDSK